MTSSHTSSPRCFFRYVVGGPNDIFEKEVALDVQSGTGMQCQILRLFIWHKSIQIINSTSWWFQPLWNILVKLGSISPCRGQNKTYLKPPTSQACLYYSTSGWPLATGRFIPWTANHPGATRLEIHIFEMCTAATPNQTTTIGTTATTTAKAAATTTTTTTTSTTTHY